MDKKDAGNSKGGKEEMPYDGKMEKRIYVKVSEELLEDFDRACEANYRTRSEVLRRAMLKYVRETKKRGQGNEKILPSGVAFGVD